MISGQFYRNVAHMSPEIWLSLQMCIFKIYITSDGIMYFKDKHTATSLIYGKETYFCTKLA